MNAAKPPPVPGVAPIMTPIREPMPIGLRHRRYSSFVILSLVMAEELIVLWSVLGSYWDFIIISEIANSPMSDDQVDTTHEPIASKGKAGGAADIVHADGSHEQADASADQSLENTVVRDDPQSRIVQKLPKQNIRQAKQQCDFCDLGSQKQ